MTSFLSEEIVKDCDKTFNGVCILVVIILNTSLYLKMRKKFFLQNYQYEFGFTRPVRSLASLANIRHFLYYSYNGISFKGLANTLSPIFGPSYLVGMGPHDSPVDSQKELGLRGY